MPGTDIFDEIARLKTSGAPFCIATVVRTADVTSAKAGAKALVTAEGEIRGHLGGACVQSAVRKAATGALRAGTARLIRMKPAADVLSLTDADGVALYKSGCPSGGTVDVLIEPYAPPPMLVVFGTTPVAAAIADQGALLGYRLATELPGVGTAVTPSDLATLALGPDDFVVIASQGHGDLIALRAALDTPCAHVAMVASRRKALSLTDRLRAEGMAPDSIARLKSPAGLDLGGVDPREIAVSVAAELIRWRSAARNSAPASLDAATATAP